MRTLFWCEFHGNKMATADQCFSGLYYGALKGACVKGQILLLSPENIDYEAAIECYATHRPGVGPVTDRRRVMAIVDAALGLVRS